MKKYVFRREEIPAYEITQKEIATKIPADLSRRVSFLERKRIMNDNFHSIIDSRLRLMFSQESYEDMRLYIDVSNNLAKRVLKEISTVYKESPKRSVNPDSGDKRYQEITGSDTGFDINQKFSRANYLLNGMNDLIFQVALSGSFLDMHTYTPDMVVVFENPDNPAVLDAILIEDCYYDAKGEKQTQWIFWSPTRHFIVDQNYNIRTVAGNEDMLNPFRDINIQLGTFFPFIDAHASTRENGFWDTYSGCDLFEGTKMIAIQNTFRNFMVPMQFKQIAVKINGVDDNKTPMKSNQIKSPQHILMTNGDATTLDWQSDLQKLGESIQQTLFGIAGNYGISQENFKLSAAATSGFARLVAKERLNELRDEQKKIWRNVEFQAFEAVRAFNNLYGAGEQIPETAKFSVDYSEGKDLQDPMEQLTINARKIEMGIINPLDLIKQENPDIETDEEAEEHLKKNIQIRNALRSRYSLDFSSFVKQGEPDGKENAGNRYAAA